MNRGDRGAASLFAVSCLALLLVLGAALGVVAAIVRAHRMAAAAADLAALAAATALQRGGDPCTAAGEIAEANGASVATCRVVGSDVVVGVTVSGPDWLGPDVDLPGTARAGPR